MRWGLCFQTPVPPAAGGIAPKPLLASGGWGTPPPDPQTAPPLRISVHACCQSLCMLVARGGQYCGTVTRYFFSTVIGNVGTFSKKYRFWDRRYFFSTFAAVLGTFKAIQKELKLWRSTFKPCPRNKE